jgi:Holliday junction resolvase RusA-like endonuclease
MVMITIQGQVPSQKNSKKISCVGSRPVLYTLPIVKDWQESAAWQLKGKPNFKEPVVISYTFYVKDKRRRDLDNMIATVNDALVKAEIIQDDDWQHLSIGQAVGALDRKNARLELKIEPKG